MFSEKHIMFHMFHNHMKYFKELKNRRLLKKELNYVYMRNLESKTCKNTKIYCVFIQNIEKK